MKKIIVILLVMFLIFFLIRCSNTFEGYDGLVEKARAEIQLAGIENMDIQIAGSTDVNGRSLVWFVTGNEYQKHSYFPIEFEVIKKNDDKFRFVKRYKAYNVAQDIAALPWNGYCFVINNDKCVKILLTDSDGNTQEIEVSDKLPTVCSTDIIPQSCTFLDKDGNEIR